MGCGIKAAYDDAEEYEALCKHFQVELRYSGYMVGWPYNIDVKHFYELQKKRRDEEE